MSRGSIMSWFGDLRPLEGVFAERSLPRLIDSAVTSDAEDWNLMLEVCRRASASENGAKEAANVLSSTFRNADSSTIRAAIRVWAVMLQNCQAVFITQCSKKKFLDTLKDVLHAERTTLDTTEQLLIVLAGAAYYWGGAEPFTAFRTLWIKVKRPEQPPEGFPFNPHLPMFASPAPAPLAIHHHPLSPLVLAQEPNNPALDEPPTYSDLYAEPAIMESLSPSAIHSIRLREVPQNSDPVPHQPNGLDNVHNKPDARRDSEQVVFMPLEEEIRRLLEECEQAKGHARQLKSNTFTRAEGLPDSHKELYLQCKKAQERFLAQIPWATAGADRAHDTQQQLRKEQLGASSAQLELSVLFLPPLPPTLEEELLSSLLQANQELLEACETYDDWEAAKRQERNRNEKGLTLESLNPHSSWKSAGGTDEISAPKSLASYPSLVPSPAPSIIRRSPIQNGSSFSSSSRISEQRTPLTASSLLIDEDLPTSWTSSFKQAASWPLESGRDSGPLPLLPSTKVDVNEAARVNSVIRRYEGKNITIYPSTEDFTKILRSRTQIVLTVTPVDQSGLFVTQTPIASKVLDFAPGSDSPQTVTWQPGLGISSVSVNREIVAIDNAARFRSRSWAQLEKIGKQNHWTRPKDMHTVEDVVAVRNNAGVAQKFALCSVSPDWDYEPLLCFRDIPQNGMINTGPPVMLQAYAVSGYKKNQLISVADRERFMFSSWEGTAQPIDLRHIDAATFLLYSDVRGKVALESVP